MVTSFWQKLHSLSDQMEGKGYHRRFLLAKPEVEGMIEAQANAMRKLSGSNNSTDDTDIGSRSQEQKQSGLFDLRSGSLYWMVLGSVLTAFCVLAMCSLNYEKEEKQENKAQIADGRSAYRVRTASGETE
jgi:hypothetical protein